MLYLAYMLQVILFALSQVCVCVFVCVCVSAFVCAYACFFPPHSLPFLIVTVRAYRVRVYVCADAPHKHHGDRHGQ